MTTTIPNESIKTMIQFKEAFYSQYSLDQLKETLASKNKEIEMLKDMIDNHPEFIDPLPF